MMINNISTVKVSSPPLRNKLTPTFDNMSLQVTRDYNNYNCCGRSGGGGGGGGGGGNISWLANFVS